MLDRAALDRRDRRQRVQVEAHAATLYPVCGPVIILGCARASESGWSAAAGGEDSSSATWSRSGSEVTVAVRRRTPGRPRSREAPQRSRERGRPDRRRRNRGRDTDTDARRGRRALARARSAGLRREAAHRRSRLGRPARGGRARRLFVMDKWRYHPGIERLAALARDKELGRIVGLRTSGSAGETRTTSTPPGSSCRTSSRSGWRSSGWRLRRRARSPTSSTERSSASSASSVTIPGTRWRSRARSAERRREVRLFCEDGVAVLPDPYSDHVQIFRRTELTEQTAPEPELRPISTELPLLRELRAFLEHLDGGPLPGAAQPRERRPCGRSRSCVP